MPQTREVKPQNGNALGGEPAGNATGRRDVL